MIARLALVAGASLAAVIGAAVASASPYIPGVGSGIASPPVPLNGRYVLNTALDRQTFNGEPDPAVPFASQVTFTTTCQGVDCLAHSSMSVRDVPLEFRWTGATWETVQRIQWTCEGQTTPATVTISLTPEGNGTLTGERSAVVGAPGCGSPRVPGMVIAPLTAAPA